MRELRLEVLTDDQIVSHFWKKKLEQIIQILLNIFKVKKKLFLNNKNKNINKDHKMEEQQEINLGL